MKTKLVNTKEYLLLVDELQIKNNMWERLIPGDYFLRNLRYGEIGVLAPKENGYDPGGHKILAYYPLTKEAPELDLPLLPNPFKAAQKQFSVEDLKFHATRFAHLCRSKGCVTNNDTVMLWEEEYSQLLSTQQLPKDFIPGFENKPIYTGDGCHEDNWVLEIIDTPQGETLVGTWVY